MRNPKVAIGLPVFNGENFLEEAIESILAQSCGDFRLIVSDNCSTDATEDICRHYERLDDRIDYHRQAENIGAAPNYNFVFRLSSAEYFKWAAHDDVLEPNFLRETVSLLNSSPGAVIAHGRSIEIDGAGRIKGDFDKHPVLAGDSPARRLWSVLWAGYFTEVFGLMRTEAISRTRLHGSFPGSDRTFMAEMLMLGNVVYSPEVIFRRRTHPDAFVHAVLWKSVAAQQSWFDPSVNTNLPRFAIDIYQFRRAVGTVPMSLSDRLACYAIYSRWAAIWAAGKIRRRVTGRQLPSLEERMKKRCLVSLEEAMLTQSWQEYRPAPFQFNALPEKSMRRSSDRRA